jgi:hypothetical protein
MSCPAESRTLDEYSSSNPRYDSRQKSGLGNKLKKIGIKIYEAIDISSKKVVYKPSIELEKILGSSLNLTSIDSSWGESCKCQGVDYSSIIVQSLPHDTSITKCFCDTVHCSKHNGCGIDTDDGESRMYCGGGG